MGKLIVIEGSDCCGKATQTKILKEKLEKDGYKVFIYSFPNYDSPTGQIIGADLLGKKEIGPAKFESPTLVDPLVVSAYYAADRRFNIDKIKEKLDDDYIVILNRYVESNMAHQGAKVDDKKERRKLYEKICDLEYNIMELPKADKVILLYMPYEYSKILRNARDTEPDLVEINDEYMKKSEQTYLEIAKLYNFTKIDCVKNDVIRNIEDISKDVYKHVTKFLRG